MKNSIQISVALLMVLGLVTFMHFGCEEGGSVSVGNGDVDGDSDGDGDGDSDGDSDGDGDGDSDGDSDGDEGCDKMDILFVVDNSGSMDLEQANLVDNFPGFIEAIEAYEVQGSGGQLDYHVGVISTGVSHNDCQPIFGCQFEAEEDGVLQNTPMADGGVCDGPDGLWMEGPGDWIVDEFACVAQLGIGGSADEMPLEALRRAMTHGTGLYAEDDGHIDDLNAGFLRDDALFVAIIITDEDDQSRPDTYPETFTIADMFSEDSAEPLDYYVDAFLDIKPTYEQMVYGVIAGPPDSSCSSDLGGASSADRLHEFLATVGGVNVVTANICDADLAGAMLTMLETIELACDDMPIIE